MPPLVLTQLCARRSLRLDIVQLLPSCFPVFSAVYRTVVEIKRIRIEIAMLYAYRNDVASTEASVPNREVSIH